jgi:hypothetical protein
MGRSDVGDPLNEQAETLAALRQVVDAAGPYLDRLPQRLVYDRAAEPLLGELGGPLPEEGSGTRAAVETPLRVGTATATASAGPRFYHFVIGGSTPAALAGDWVVSMLDQNAFVRASSRFADAAETVTLDWLRELVGLPTDWGGAPTASATFANLTSLALATHWWAERHGVDVSSAGLAGLPRMPVLSGGGTCTPAPARPCRCSATARTRWRSSPATTLAGSTWPPCGDALVSWTALPPC